MSDFRDDVVLTVSCPSCGEVDLTSDQVWLVIASAAGRSHYRFSCANCNRDVSRPADETVVALLSELVAVEVLEIPAEALESHDGPPLTSDDLLDLMLALGAHDVIETAPVGALKRKRANRRQPPVPSPDRERTGAR